MYPTRKLKSVYPTIRDITQQWNSMIADAISEEELENFNRILDKIMEKSIGINSEKEVKK